MASAAIATAAGFTPAFAQDTAPAAEAPTTEKVTVTGVAHPAKGADVGAARRDDHQH